MRSLSQVQARLEAERRDRERAVTRQSFFCSRRNRITTPGECHDCFASLPYLERLVRWSESRMQCMTANSLPVKMEETTAPAAGEKHESTGAVRGESRMNVEKHLNSHEIKEELPFSVEEYMVEALLEFLLDFDSLSERFETWWLNLADAARNRVPRSAELGEMILWFVEKLEEFKKSLVFLGRAPEKQVKPFNPRRKNVG